MKIRFALIAVAAGVVGSIACAPAARAGDAEPTTSSVSDQAALDAVLKAAGGNARQLRKALADVPAAQKPALVFLVANMPDRDAKTLSTDFLLKTVADATNARASFPWAKDLPDEVFLNYVLPYASLNEKREDWHASLAEKSAGLVKDAQSASEAALALNKQLFPLLKVQYHPSKRPKPDQAPSESMAANYASCSGLSILLVDACRSVGVPARVVGTPDWFLGHADANGNHGGNHTWVQIWDGQWHTLGASEVSSLDDAWFNGNAGKAHESADPINQIYAARWARGERFFPMVWAMDQHYVPAEVVTTDYAGAKPVEIKGPRAAGQTLVVRQNGRLIAWMPFDGSASLRLVPGETYDFTLGDHAQTTAVPADASAIDLSDRSAVAR